MPKKKVIVLGGNGIGMIAAWIMERCGDAETIGFINDVHAVGETIGTKKKYQVIGTSEDVPRYLEDSEYMFFIGFHGMQREKSVYEKICAMNIPNDRLYSPIDPTAVVAYDYSQIGSGILIGPFAQVGPDCVVGDNTVILGNAFIGHDTSIGKFCHIASNAVIGSNVKIENACHIGMNATVREFVQVEPYCLVGMGSVVLSNVKEQSIVVGNPARLLRIKDDIGGE